MLVIRDEQLAVLTRALRARFVDEAYDHVRRYFPDRCNDLGPQITMEWVRDGLSRAKQYGFQSKYDQLRYLNVLFEFGREFEQSEANKWASPYLESERPPTIRMDLLMEEACRRLYPQEEPYPPAEPIDSDEEGRGEFDGIKWQETAVDANYVPQSIQPEIDPIDPPTVPGRMPAQVTLSDEDEDEGSESDLEEEIVQEELDGGW